MGIKPIKKVRVGEQVFQQMKGLLISGEWRPGDKLPSETELAEQFGISRITVRQALQRLSALNLIETRLGEGSFVKTVEIDQPLDNLISIAYLGTKTQSQVLEFRTILEVASAGLAAIRAGDEDLLLLQENLSHMKAIAAQKDDDAFSDLDLEFHTAIGQITKNPLIIRTNSILRDVLEPSMKEVIQRMGYETALRYHAQIIDAIRQKDSALAEDLMRKHIEENKAFFPEKDAQ
ncbi:MAG: FadR family transcriptional regulator [Lachnospiraceae bacterium]|nr:FadR family transcriptional regulator [Lachnospiraceae bacterium]